MKTVSLALALLALVACTRERPTDERPGVITEATPPGRTMDEQDRAGTTTLTSAAWVPNDSAMDRLALARCAREASCGTTAEEGRAPATDRAACLAETKPRTWSTLRADVCPSGIHGDKLEECIQAIQHEPCPSPLASLSRLVQCRTSTLCGP